MLMPASSLVAFGTMQHEPPFDPCGLAILRGLRTTWLNGGSNTIPGYGTHQPTLNQSAPAIWPAHQPKNALSSAQLRSTASPPPWLPLPPAQLAYRGWASYVWDQRTQAGLTAKTTHKFGCWRVRSLWNCISGSQSPCVKSYSKGCALRKPTCTSCVMRLPATAARSSAPP